MSKKLTIFAAFLCGGTAVLADAGVLKSRRAAYHQYLKPDLVSASGAKWDAEQRVVVSGRIITAKTWDDAEIFVRTLLNELTGPR